MGVNPPGSIGAVVIDANIMIAFSAHETGRDVQVTARLNHYATLGYSWYAPGAIITETLYALCKKLETGTLTASNHTLAIGLFEKTMGNIYPPPSGEAALIVKAEQFRANYGCSRSADGVYIALADELSQSMPTVLLTFDQGLPKQAARNAPAVIVELL